MITTILFFALAASIGYNLFQSIRKDQREGCIKNLECELSRLRLSNQTNKAKARMRS